MRPFLYLLLFTLLPNISFSQNYKCLQPEARRYFISGTNYLRGMRIDAVTVSNGDTIYHPYHTPRFALPDTNAQIGYIGLDSNGASWLGKNVIQHPDGTFIFDNEWSAGVTIKTQASVGDSWTFFSDTTNISYTATVTAMDTMMVLGTIDSIRIITITAYSAGTPNPIDPVNNFQIKLSKEHGFAQVFDLYTFPYHRPGRVFFIEGQNHCCRRCFDYYMDLLLNNFGTGDGWEPDTDPDSTNSVFHLVPFHNPAMTEVFNYGIGDMYASYETRTMDNPPGIVEHTDSYEDSIISVNGTSTRTYQIKQYHSTHDEIVQGINISYVNTYDTAIYTNVYHDTDYLLDTTLMPEEWHSQYFYHYYPNDAPDTSACYWAGRYGISNEHINFLGSQFWLDTYNTDFGIQFNEHDVYYKLGYGQDGTYTNHEAGSILGGYEILGELNYAYKSGINCIGFRWPAKVSTVAPVTYKIYPNPAASTLQIDNESTLKYSCSMYDMLGQRVTVKENNTGKTSLNVANLSNGIYLLTISDERGIQINRKIVVQH